MGSPEGREGGLVLAVNVLTVTLSVGLLRWAWRNRTALSARPPA